jgi:hypothetical protein
MLALLIVTLAPVHDRIDEKRTKMAWRRAHEAGSGDGFVARLAFTRNGVIIGSDVGILRFYDGKLDFDGLESKLLFGASGWEEVESGRYHYNAIDPPLKMTIEGLGMVAPNTPLTYPLGGNLLEWHKQQRDVPNQILPPLEVHPRQAVKQSDLQWFRRVPLIAAIPMMLPFAFVRAAWEDVALGAVFWAAIWAVSMTGLSSKIKLMHQQADLNALAAEGKGQLSRSERQHRLA